MTAGRKRQALTTDDLLRRQEEPVKKKSKTSPPIEIDDLDETSSDEILEEEDPLTSGGSDSDFSMHMDRIDLQRVKPRTIVQQTAPKPAGGGGTFASLGISAPLQASLAAMSIRTPTEVQAACIPPLLAGQSCLITCGTCGSSDTFVPQRQRLYRKRKNRVWKDDCVCSSYLAETVCGPIWNLCTSAHTDEASLNFAAILYRGLNDCFNIIGNWHFKYQNNLRC